MDGKAKALLLMVLFLKKILQLNLHLQVVRLDMLHLIVQQAATASYRFLLGGRLKKN
jgi:hypothetical protein